MPSRTARQAKSPARGMPHPLNESNCLSMQDSSLSGWDTERLRALVSNVPGAIYRCSPSGDWAMEFISDEIRSIAGYPPDELIGNRVRTFASVIHEDDRDSVERSVEEALAQGLPFELEYRIVHADGSTRWVYERGQGIFDDGGAVAYLDGVICDITARKQAEEQLAFLAYHDPLTGLPNRTLFQEHLGVALLRAERTNAAVAVCFVDLDGFKLVNDSFGHDIGDDLLVEVAMRLQRIVRSHDVVARQSGDEFLILLADLPCSVADDRSASEIAVQVATAIRSELQTPIPLSGTEISVNASVGISMYPKDAPDAATLLKHADIAMYTAKEQGRNDHALYVGDERDPRRQLTLASRLRDAIHHGELVLHYQPLVELVSGHVVGAEALVRWQDGDRGLIQPNDFIPIAERTGLIKPLSDWVIQQACQQSVAWRDQGLDLYVSVNLPASFWRPTRISEVLETIESFGLNPNRMMVEITESTAMGDERATAPILAELHRRGLRVALDDFGKGHSSLSRLNQMQVTTLKIDRAFICDLPGDASAAILVKSIIQLANNLGLQPLAEGIETSGQRDFLAAHGCTLGQGYLYSRPVPAAEMIAVFNRLNGKAAA
jgi:diguanylate cyclase (GGDEF)-like protein/PAS domain S-box-containing protein